MKRVSMLSLLALCVGACGYPSTPADVTADQIATYQANVIKGCTHSALQRGLPQAKAEERCQCIIGVLRSRLQTSDWQLAYFHATRGDNAAELKVMDPVRDVLRASCPR